MKNVIKAHDNPAFSSSAAWGKTGSLMWTRAAWSPRDNLSGTSVSPGSFFSWEPLGSLEELFRCCNLPTVAISFRNLFPHCVKALVHLGPEKGPFPLEREWLGRCCCPTNRLSSPDAVSLTIPDGCTIFPR